MILPDFVEAFLEEVALRLDAYSGRGDGVKRERDIGLRDRSHGYRKNSNSVG